ncbi:uncharacterized protein LOC107480884 [Arachis duranensis]|uniref:Uncharacterized protein LOC107480884 n=1 Tax=Arachis duranensis TaxID=130453 RepID=A0A6P4CUI9_ARADU|nr:uncharacterized protein LOC107480884 [Arachis duranensis]
MIHHPTSTSTSYFLSSFLFSTSTTFRPTMANLLDDAPLWLPPPQFLDGPKGSPKPDPDAVFAFPSEFPYEFGVSSPVESVAGSTETESSDEEEDFFAGLTRRLSQATIHDSRKQLATEKPEACKTRGMAGSPQSTLSGIGSWSGRSLVSGEGTPNGSSRVPSPSTTPFADQNDPWEVIYQAAGQVARMKLNDHVSQSNRGFLNSARATAAAPKNLHTTVCRSFCNHAPQVSQEQVLNQQCGSTWGRQGAGNKAYWLLQQQNRAREVCYESVKCGNRLQSAWPQPHQNQNNLQYVGSGHRVPVPVGSAAKRASSGGTGVFLPRHYGNTAEPRKKTGSAPVVVPAKVVHALNLNMEGFNGPSLQPCFSDAFATDYDALVARRNAVLMQNRLRARREEAASYEVRLPQEWTY